jgi:hypothetical protein
LLGKEKAHKKELLKASEIGSQAHAMIEWTIKSMMCMEQGPAPIISPKAQFAFSRWLKWKNSVRLKPIHIEKTVFSYTYQYAGTMDLLAEVNGEVAVVDWKTGKAIYPEALLQNAAYRHAVREMGMDSPVKGIIVRLPKSEADPEFEVADAGEEADNLAHFLDVQKVWTWLRSIEAERDLATGNGKSKH